MCWRSYGRPYFFEYCSLYFMFTIFMRRQQNDTIPLFLFLHFLLSNSTSTSKCASTNTQAAKEKAWRMVQQLLSAFTWKQWVSFCYWIKACCLQNQYSPAVDRKVAFNQNAGNLGKRWTQHPQILLGNEDFKGKKGRNLSWSLRWGWGGAVVRHHPPLHAGWWLLVIFL